MRLDVTQAISGYDGKPIKEGEKPATIRSLLLYALNAFQVDERPSPEDKAKCYALSVRIHEEDNVTLSLDDRTFLKKRAGLMLKPVALGPITAALEEPAEEQRHRR